MRRSHCEFPGLDSCTPLLALLYRVVSARKSKIAKEAEVRQRWNQLERARAHLTMLQAIAAASPAAHRFRSITVRSAACRCSATAVIFGAFSIVVQEAAETLKASAAQVLFDTTKAKTQQQQQELAPAQSFHEAVLVGFRRLCAA